MALKDNVQVVGGPLRMGAPVKIARLSFFRTSSHGAM